MFSCWVERKAARGFVEEDGLGAVPVVGVEVHDQDLPDPFGQRMPRRDGNVVEQAEAHGGFRLGMVPRRADDGKGVLRLA